MRQSRAVLVSLILLGVGAVARADAPPRLELTLPQAELRAVDASNLLKSYVAEQSAAESQSSAQFENLLPKLSLQGNYTYYGTIPTVSFFPGAAIPFGTHDTYSFGPVLSYTLWDTFSGIRSYQASSLLAKAREEDARNAKLQLLASVRSAYVQVQLGLEELKLIDGSLELAKAQDRDVATRFRAGAAAKLDVVTASRSVLAYEIQFKQRQPELASAVRDLLTLLGDSAERDLARPGPPDIAGITLAIRLDSLDQLLAEEKEPASPPGDRQPQIHSQLLQAEAAERSAQSQTGKLFPAVQLVGGLSYLRPDIPNPPSYRQETAAVTVSLPLFLGDPTRHLVSQQRSESEAAERRADQLRDNLRRDYSKARDTLASLRDQRELAAQDVSQSEEQAKLYFVSYKAGRLNLIDVQNANNQALQAKVNAARIEAQILQQIILLKSLAAEELNRG